MSPPLLVHDLCKRYSKSTIFTGFSLQLQAGEAVALQGPNGAGKSTFLGCLSGTVIPDQGTITIAGHDLNKAPIQARTHLRYLPQELEFPAGISGQELLDFYAQVYQDEHNMAAARELASLGEQLAHLITSYSVGMRRRLACAGLCFGDARLIILDEPFSGLDTESRQRLQSWVLSQQKKGAAILLAAHEQEAPLLHALGARSIQLASS